MISCAPANIGCNIQWLSMCNLRLLCWILLCIVSCTMLSAYYNLHPLFGSKALAARCLHLDNVCKICCHVNVFGCFLDNVMLWLSIKIIAKCHSPPPPIRVSGLCVLSFVRFYKSLRPFTWESSDIHFHESFRPFTREGLNFHFYECLRPYAREGFDFHFNECLQPLAQEGFDFNFHECLRP